MKLWRFLAVMALAYALGVLALVRAEGGSKSEDALRVQLAKTQAALDLATKQNSTALAKLAAQGRVAAKERSAASDTADSNAADAEAGRERAAAADDKAVHAAVLQRGLEDQALHIADQAKFGTYATLITLVFGFLTFLASNLFSSYSANQKHKWEMEATALHRKLELDAIAESTRASKEAARVANDVNQKILAVGLRVADGTLLKPHEGEPEE